MTGAWTERAALPGGDIPGANFSLFLQELRRRHPWLPQGVAHGYARRYGTRVETLLSDAKSIGDLGRPFGGTLYEREARFLAEEEWATAAEDIIERRTKHALHLTDKERADFTSWFQMLTPQAA
jgi:glycerol-3-phosphate dehydrogenase